jgi:hypothetical protein
MTARMAPGVGQFRERFEPIEWTTRDAYDA